MGNNTALHIVVSLLCVSSMTLGLLLGIYYAGGIQSSNVSYICMFDNVIGRFEVTSKEYSKNSSMIQVSKDGKVHAFKREKLLACLINDL